LPEIFPYLIEKIIGHGAGMVPGGISVPEPSLYFFMVFFVPSFIVVITVLLYFLVYFMVAVLTGLVLNLFPGLASLPAAVKAFIAMVVGAVAVYAGRAYSRWKPKRPIVSLRKMPADAPGEYGNKAVSLAEIVSAGLRVPPGYGVSFRLFERYAAKNSIPVPSGDKGQEEYLEAAGKVTDLIKEGRFPVLDLMRLRAVYLSLWLRGGIEPAFIVRSSFGGEDEPGHLSPGQYQSFSTRVPFRKFLSAMRECWCSFFTERAYIYREHAGTGHRPKLSIIVQLHLKGDLIGTAAGADPATGYRERIVMDVAAPPEDDPHAVSEQGDADSIIFETALRYPDPPEDERFPFLPELAAGLRSMERRIGAVPLVEWMWAGGRLYFLQARKLEGIPEVETYVAGGMAEMTAEALCPMTISLIESGGPLDSMITGPVKKYMDGNPPENILKKINSRVYASFTRLRELAEFLKPSPGELLELLKLCRGEAPGMRRFIGTMDAELDDLRKIDPAALETSRLLETIKELNSLMQGPGAAHQATAAHLAQVLWTIFEKTAAALGISRCESRKLEVYEEDCIAMKRARMLEEIASGGNSENSVERLSEEYVRLFGFLGPADEMDLSAPRIVEAEEEFREYLISLSKGAGEDGESKGKQENPTLKSLLRGRRGQNVIPWDTVFLRISYNWTRTYSTMREELRYRLLEGWWHLRRMLIELAGREPYSEMLDDRELIFFLDIGGLKEPGNQPELADVARRRMADFEKNRQGPAAAVIHLDSDGKVIVEKRDAPAAAPGEYSGIPASPGAAEGRARLVSRPEEVDKVHKGDVAVVESCSPWMSVVFARASAVVAVSGGVVSHLALAAREYGKPMVVGVHGLAASDVEGRTVEVDAVNGKVRIKGEG